MTIKKINCTECPNYSECSIKTKFFVNFCGSNPERYSVKIKSAIEDCLNHKGFLFKETRLVNLETLALRKYT